MIRIYLFLGVISIFLIGYVILKRELNALRRDLGFLSMFYNKFIEFAELYSRRMTNPGLYQWLALNSAKSQKMCSRWFRGTLVAPFGGYISRNHEFITNTIPRMKNDTADDVEVNMTEDILLKTIGVLQGGEKLSLADVKNPFKWFQYGVRFVIGFPIRLLKWFGIINSNTFYRLSSSKFFKVVSGFVALIAFISSVITILAGWDQSVEFIKKVLKIE